MKEQEEIAKIPDSAYSMIQKEIIKKNGLESTKKALMQKLLTGKIVVEVWMKQIC
ncbi:MAG: hypothetical protein KAK00_03710 [Nanoarchaeota archaeon]|nr:hypothetical protein [Nanoarchaeota archaeon]